MRGKEGAIELSIGTIVIIVLAMSMLILGMVLVRNIFSGANNAIDMTQDELEGEISKLFVEDKRTVVYLPNQIAKNLAMWWLCRILMFGRNVGLGKVILRVGLRLGGLIKW
jgi:hypothetical protein